ncbi:MAG: hypothetical protein AAFV77_13720, partial [Planctomycetota bacterium]
MMDKQPEIEVVNAVIRNVQMGFDRDIFLCPWVFLDYEFSTQGFGGFVCGGMPDVVAGDHGNQPNFCAEFIVACLRAADV